MHTHYRKLLLATSIPLLMISAGASATNGNEKPGQGPGETTGRGTTKGGANGYTHGGTTKGGSDGYTRGGTTKGGSDGYTRGGTTKGGSDGYTRGGTTKGGSDGYTRGGTTKGGSDGYTRGGTTKGGSDGYTRGGTTKGGSDGFTRGGTTKGGSDGYTHGGTTKGSTGYTHGGTTKGSTGYTHGGTTKGGSDGYTHGGTTKGGSDGYTRGGTTKGGSDGFTRGGTTKGGSDGYTHGGTTKGGSDGYTHGNTTQGHTTKGSTSSYVTSSVTSTTTHPTTSTSSYTSTTTQPTTSTVTTGYTTTTGEGDTSTSTTGEETTSTSTTGRTTKEKRDLKHKLELLFHLSFDFGKYIVNLTPQLPEPQPSGAEVLQYDSNIASDALVYGDFKDGFQKTTYGNIEVGLGARIRWWYDNTSGIRDELWAYVGVLPIVGKETESVRYARTLEAAREMGGRREIPESAADLDKWDTGDSISYIGHGGIIFSAGGGAGPIGLGVAKLAKGTWETYVEKVAPDHVYVKTTSGRLSSLSLFTHASIVSLSATEFRSADDGFSYLFDLTTEVGRKAYEDMIRGNALASERFAQEKPKNLVMKVAVQKIETFRTVSSGRLISRSLTIPIIWDKTYSRGKVQSFTSSDLHVGRNSARVHYGIFSDSENTRFWFKHREEDLMFYGARYSMEDWDSKDKSEGMFGSYSYAFRSETSDKDRLERGIKNLIKKTGLQRLTVDIPNRDRLDYTGVEFNIKFSDENTMRLMAAAQRMSESDFVEKARSKVEDYFSSTDDPHHYCYRNRGSGEDSGCVNVTKYGTAKMARQMYQSLRTMYKTMTSEPKKFAAAYGEFGEGMAKNMFTFKLAMELAGSGAMIDYLIEGTYLSMYYKSWVVNSNGTWVETDPDRAGLPFDPQLRHSKARGVIIGNGDAGHYPHFIPLSL